MNRFLRYSIGSFILLSLQAQTVSANTDVQDRLCARVQERYVSGTAAFTRVNDRIQRRLGFSCLEAQSVSQSFTASTVAIEFPLDFAHKLDHFSEFLTHSLPDQLYTETEEFSTILTQFELVSETEKQQYASRVISLGIAHITHPDDTIVRIRYNNNFAKLIGLVKKYGSNNDVDQIGLFLKNRMLTLGTGESESEFAQRSQITMNLWNTQKIFVLYWPGTPDKTTVIPSDIDGHVALLHQIAEASQKGIPPGLDYLHLLILRDDIGATAAEGTIWFSTHASFRTFIHEMGHVIHFTHPIVFKRFNAFEDLYSSSNETVHAAPGDFASSYHTNAFEDFAELYTEYVLGGNVLEHPFNRAKEQLQEGDSLLLKKIFFLTSTLFSEGQTIPVYASNSAIKQIPAQKINGNVSAVLWDTIWLKTP